MERSCLQERPPPTWIWAMGFAGTSRWRRRGGRGRGAGYKAMEPSAWCLVSLCRMGQLLEIVQAAALAVVIRAERD